MDKVEIGNATLYCGDCMDILPILPKVSLVVTSPPYNIVKTGWGDRHRAGMHKAMQAKFKEEWYADEMDEKEYQAQQKWLIRECLRLSPVVCYNHKIRYAIKRAGRVYHPMEWLSEFPLWSEVIWNRGGGVALNCRRPIPCDERIYVISEKPPVWNNFGYTSVWNFPPDSVERGHPCSYPTALPERCIQMFTEHGESVLDPYLGSGTTGVACANLGRKFIGIEIERKYFDISCERIATAYAQGRLFA